MSLAMPGALSPAEAHERICAVEQDRDLLRHTLGGWCVWPILRPEASICLTGMPSPGFRAASVPDRAWRCLVDAATLVRARNARLMVRTYSSGLLERIGDRYADIWFDDALTDTDPLFKVECMNNASFAERSGQALVRKSLSTALLDVNAGVWSRWRRPAELGPVAAAIARAMREGLGIVMDEGWVRQRLARFLGLLAGYRTLLRRVRPLRVAVVDPYEHPLAAAARELGIGVLELQHGLIVGHHPGYSWPDYAVPYRPSMPLADRVLLYGEHWRREIHSAFWGDDLPVVGSPRIDRYRAQPAVEPDGPCRILVTTQGLDAGPIAAFLGEFLHLAAGRFPVKLAVKLHPSYDADAEVYLGALARFGDQVEVLTGHLSDSTLAWIRRSNLHVSAGSASHYDAVGLGVPTVILPFTTHEFVLPLWQAGHAMLARSAEELLHVASAWRCHVVSSAVSTHYFQANAREHMRGELGLLMS